MAANFKDDLAFSHSCSDEPYWEVIYRKAFSGLQTITDLRESGDHQYKGIDRVLVLKTGKAIYIDEKVRRKDYGDIALEYVSNNTRNTPGWVCKDLFCDYIAYAIQEKQRCYLLPVIQLQQAWKNNKNKWLESYGERQARNEGYETLFCPVPIPVLFSAMGNCLRINYGQQTK